MASDPFLSAKSLIAEFAGGGNLSGMETLGIEESRVLGVLIEKAMTTPEQYPLSPNATVNGCNQKNNREPVMTLDEDAVRRALDSLRAKGLVVRVDVPGSRVSKFRHEAAARLGFNARELAVMAELLLRGPQTVGEIRGRASRMHELESLEVVQTVLDGLAARAQTMVKRIAPWPGTRAERYEQLLGEASPIEAQNSAPGANIDGGASATTAIAAPAESELRERIDRLENEVATLAAGLRRLAKVLGEPDPLGQP
jgi:uncharacterized protein YceH (UPF0502 family)